MDAKEIRDLWSKNQTTPRQERILFYNLRKLGMGITHDDEYVKAMGFSLWKYKHLGRLEVTLKQRILEWWGMR